MKAIQKVPPGKKGRKAAPVAIADDMAVFSVNALPWAQVFIDGKMVSGQTPLQNHTLSTGKHDVWVFYPSLNRKSRIRTITFQPGQNKPQIFKADED